MSRACETGNHFTVDQNHTVMGWPIFGKKYRLARQSRDTDIVMMLELSKRRILILAGVFLLVAQLPSPSVADSPKIKNSLQIMQDRRRDRFKDFSNQITKLAQFCDEKGLAEEAIKVRSRIIVPDSQSLHVDKLPSEVRGDIPASVTGDDRHWQTQLRFLETEYAKDLYAQSRQALTQGNASYAYNLVREAALHNPDHPQVRRILGYVREGNEWVTPFASSQIKKQNVWNEEFGWLPKIHVQRYIGGERLYKNRWISAEKERELRRDFNAAWDVRTDHYLIKTNVSLESGVEMGKALEDFYSVFNETFAGFFHSEEQLKDLFEGSSRPHRNEAKPYIVHFYRTRDEYCDRLRKYFPSIDQTNGVYMTSERIAHFYYDADRDHEGTLFHEATHQLFFEIHSNRTICENHHFWIIEGIACYMESFQRKNGTFSLGDPNYIRFVGARHNLLEKKYYVPLREFSGYGMAEFQGMPGPELSKNYTQASGLARFFMHHDKGRYREALVKHLSQLYSRDERIRERADGLDELTGVDFTELDRQYAEDAHQTDSEENQARRGTSPE